MSKNSYGSAHRHVIKTCARGIGHEWQTRIYNRTGKGSGCPKCRSGSSKLEIRLYTEFKSLFDEVN